MTALLRTPVPRITAPRIIALRLAATLALAAGIAGIAAPDAVLAQDSGDEARLRKLEAEVRALQRKVFPGGDGRYFEPQIGPGEAAAPATAGTGAAPATTAVTDILVRLDALEAQLQRLTARSEEQANALAQLDGRLTALETASGAPITTAPALSAVRPAATGPVATVPVQTAAAPTTRPAAITPMPAPATTPAPAPVAAAAPGAATGPSATRLAAVQAIAKPQTADAGDDEYSYGFRLWNAGFYPEARQQLTKFVEQYPTHARISFGRNLLGRAFLDDNMPSEAARWFLKNYQSDKTGDRAPDSLLYLGKSMIALGDTRKACIALAEFGETYPAVATGRLAEDYKASLAKVKCN